MDAFGIFEGGGAKGLAHIGALKAAEEKGIEFIGVAGASAGSIVAALVAARYRADELYDPDKQPRGAFDFNFIDLLGQDALKKFDKLRLRAQRLSRHSVIGLWATLPYFYLRNHQMLSCAVRERGLFNAGNFACWLNGKLKEKLKGNEKEPSGEGGKVLFRDLLKPLKVVGTDLAGGGIKIFQQPTDNVAEAVAASISIPFFFRPVRIEDSDLVDGGLLSNFPAWLFDEERYRAGPFVPTYGFKLVRRPCAPDLTHRDHRLLGAVVRATRAAVRFLRNFGTTPHSGAPQPDPPPHERLPRFVARLVATTLAGDEVLETREIENLHTVPLRVSVGTLDFNLTPAQKDALYHEGHNDARTFFSRQAGAADPRRMRAALRLAHDAMIQALGGEARHLRVNIAMYTTSKRLRITHSFNMDDDADDRLEFETTSGACGLCWRTQDFVICPLEEARHRYSEFLTKWAMNKYQQALVRPSLRSLLCAPIFKSLVSGENRPDQEKQPVGTLNFDSDEDLIDRFHAKAVQEVAAAWADTLADLLFA